MNNTWCVLPWTHLCVRTDSTLKPCCRFLSNNPSNEFKTTLNDVNAQGADALNDTLLTEIRRKMLAGETVPGCQKCYSQESNKKSKNLSLRQYFNKELPIDISNISDKFEKLRYIEMSIDNICNLQCKMCDSKFSSKLQNRDKLLGNTVYKKLEPNFDKLSGIDLSNLSRVKILGGEPFITPNFEKFLDFLINKSDPKNIILDIATNGTKFPSQRVIKKLNMFKSVFINVSLDAYDKSNDYQRVGSSFEVVSENAKKYETYIKNSIISFHVTITTLTANFLGKTLDYLNSNSYHYSVDFVRDPFYLSLLHIPEILAKWILEKNSKNSEAYRMIETYLKEHVYKEELWEQFQTVTKRLDKYYKLELKEYNLELYEFLIENGLYQ